MQEQAHDATPLLLSRMVDSHRKAGSERAGQNCRSTGDSRACPGLNQTRHVMTHQRQIFRFGSHMTEEARKPRRPGLDHVAEQSAALAGDIPPTS
jgi:hypothetical protein